MIKRFLIAIVLLALVCGGIVYFNIFRGQMIAQFFADMPRPSVTVSVVEVEPITWTPAIEAIGTVSASQGVDLTVETSGIVREILFKSNAKVTAGQVLVQLDDDIERADLDAAKTQADLDKAALERAIALQKRGVGSSVAVEEASAKASSSVSQVAKAQAALDQKQLTAPFTGTIGIPRIDPGQYLTPGNIVSTLQDLETMRADFSVPEQQLDLLRIGQPVSLGLDLDNLTFKGSVLGIDPKVDSSSRLVSVRARLDNPQGKLSPGQFVQVRVELPQEKDIIAVVQTAVVTSLYGDYVYLVEDAEPAPDAPAAPAAPASEEKPADGNAAAPAPDAPASPALVAKQIFVKTGRRSGGVVEITEGVKAGDRVVTAGQNRLSNGSPVVINNAVDPAATAKP